ncbi:hypothetical protein BDQ12DRAFT_249811 [Crucibulum laeve]|uniref:Uncharacterized protein n=1 Tax=Crucibulum laeve TaxID=68775 RepID=A0A5C3LWZ1_9AGAR|nr:hypothetical protein BDQ12DRAFT_249811 [Crucibulum laeve]
MAVFHKISLQVYVLIRFQNHIFRHDIFIIDNRLRISALFRRRRRLRFRSNHSCEDFQKYNLLGYCTAYPRNPFPTRSGAWSTSKLATHVSVETHFFQYALVKNHRPSKAIIIHIHGCSKNIRNLLRDANYITPLALMTLYKHVRSIIKECFKGTQTISTAFKISIFAKIIKINALLFHFLTQNRGQDGIHRSIIQFVPRAWSTSNLKLYIHRKRRLSVY